MRERFNDRRRRPLQYVRDADGNEVLEVKKERRREVHSGVPVFREVEAAYKVRDDNTERIATAFRDWMKDQV